MYVKKINLYPFSWKSIFRIVSTFQLKQKYIKGLGKSPNFRVGPGKDSKGVEVYSLNYVTASWVI